MFTLTQLQVLQNALAAGVTRVQYNGRVVDYGTTDMLIKAIEYIQGELNAQSGVIGNRQVRVYTGKGLGPSGFILDGFDQQ